MKITTAYSFRLYPSKQQEQKLIATLNLCRFTYNTLLDTFNKHPSITKNELQHSLLALKITHPELNNVYSKVLQYENSKLFFNLKSLSQRKKQGKKVGRLRFKGKGFFKTFTYNQSGFKIIQRDTRYDLLHLSKIGNIPMIMHRDIEGTIKQITIKHHLSGKWHASIIAETKCKVPQHTSKKQIGIDMGLLNFTVDSNGHKIAPPKHLHRSLKKLKHQQQRLSRKKKGSKNRNRQRIKVARIHEKIVNQRDDFLHKLSHYYTTNYSLIAVENLVVSSMIQHPCLSRSIADASWSKFIQMLCCKAARAGGIVVKVEPRGTSQTCSNCGKRAKKSLQERIHHCNCGLIMDRDYNSAIIILQRALGQELPEVTPVEIEPLPIRTKVPIPSEKEGLVLASERQV